MTSIANQTQETALITPYGGHLVNLLVPADQSADLQKYANQLPSVRLSLRETCDLELLATGAFSPLDRFMGQADLQSVMDSMRLSSGHIFPMPITLSVNPRDDIRIGQQIALRDHLNDIVAIMTVREMYDLGPRRSGREGLRDAGSAPPDGGRDEPLGKDQPQRAD